MTMNPKLGPLNPMEPAHPSGSLRADAKRDEDRDESSTASHEAADFTASAPSLPPELSSTRDIPARRAPPTLDEGQTVADFEILGLLGRGATGAVYLARQQSLGRCVALKVTRSIGREARTMAMLEHKHIVQVFSETVDASDDRRLLCMQYVPGPTLAHVLARLSKMPRSQLSGAALVAAIDEHRAGEVSLDVEGLRERERLANSSYVWAACWLVARLAEALCFAHQRGVLHRDIKPANVLIDPYGRPMLADFGLAFAAQSVPSTGDEVFGGTLAYMAPEHLAAFNSADAATSDAVDQRSDIYSLGVVLYELLALDLPHATANTGQLGSSELTAMEQARCLPPAALHTRFAEIPYAVDYAARRCLEGDPQRRYTDAGQLAQALDGCCLLERAREHLPAAGGFARAVERAPLAASVALAILPHLLGNVFTPAYNALILFPRFSEHQQIGLVWIAAIYGAVTFPALIIAVAILYLPAVRVLRRMATDRPPTLEEVDYARRRVLTVPLGAAGLSVLGWLPVLVVIPVCLHVISARLSGPEFAHLAVSVLLGLLIATPYSFLVLQYFVVRIFYPEAWADAASFATASRRELAPAPRRLRWFQMGALLVPLVGAVLIVALGPEAFESTSYVSFRVLIVCLIVLGMAGVPLSIHVGGLILKSIEALTRHDAAAKPA